MAGISFQLKALQKLINVPYRIKFVDSVVLEEDFEDMIIYINIKL